MKLYARYSKFLGYVQAKTKLGAIGYTEEGEPKLSDGSPIKYWTCVNYNDGHPFWYAFCKLSLEEWDKVPYPKDSLINLVTKVYRDEVEKNISPNQSADREEGKQ